MGMLDKISKPLKDYISLADLIGFISEYHNETIRDIALYLSHYDFYNIPNYSLSIDNKFYENGFDDFGNYSFFNKKNILDGLIKEFGFFDTTVSRSMMREMTFSKIRHYLSKMDNIEINNQQYLAIETLYRANIYYKKSDLLELAYLSEYLKDNQEFKEWDALYVRPFSDFDNQWYNEQPTTITETADLQAENARLQARIAELESQLNRANTTPTIKHTNQALQALHDVLVTHWQDYDPSQPKTRPKQSHIQSWIVTNYPEIEPSKALWIDKIIRHGTHE